IEVQRCTLDAQKVSVGPDVEVSLEPPHRPRVAVLAVAEAILADLNKAKTAGGGRRGRHCPGRAQREPRSHPDNVLGEDGPGQDNPDPERAGAQDEDARGSKPAKSPGTRHVTRWTEA